MVYELKDCRTGARETKRKTTVEISVKDGIADFVFTAENCKFYCPYGEYNAIHSDGDACEVLIATDPNRKVYYEIELSPLGGLMTAKMTNNGDTPDKSDVLLDIDFVQEPFVETKVERRGNGYVAEMRFSLKNIYTGEGKIYFNAYRLDTDGGKCLKEKQLLFALNPTMRNKFHVPSKFLMLEDYL